MANEADTAAYFGRLRTARDLSREAMDSAKQAGEDETAATYAAISALREGLFGDAGEARRTAAFATAHSSARDVEFGAALALAYAGESGRARMLTDDLGKRFPEDTIIQFNYMPTLLAELAVNQGNASAAIKTLTVAAPYELGQTTASTYGWNAFPKLHEIRLEQDRDEQPINAGRGGLRVQRRGRKADGILDLPRDSGFLSPHWMGEEQSSPFIPTVTPSTLPPAISSFSGTGA